MLRQRLIVVLILLPVGGFLIYLGGWAFAVFMTLLISIAAWEFGSIYMNGGLRPARGLVVLGVAALMLARHWRGFELEPVLLVGFSLVSLLVHLIDYERGWDQAALDFNVTLSGIVYLGVLGGYFISIRDLPEGVFWVAAVLPAIWWADTGAYFIGRVAGKRKLAPRLSPKKTWEGYLAGILVSMAGTPLFVWIYMGLGMPSDSRITLGRAVLLGLVLGVLPTLGDLGISMIKRQFGQKDSGKLLPGHGGLLDRTDSWLWGVSIGYYLIVWFFI